MDNERTRQLIRAWLMQRHAHRDPLPPPEHIRRKVGWAPAEPDRGTPADSGRPLLPVAG